MTTLSGPAAWPMPGRSWRRGEGEVSAVDAAGGSLAVSRYEEAAILGDDSELAEKTLRKLLAEGRFTPDGGSDIPGGVVLAFNKEHGTGYSARDISLDV